MSIFLVYLTTLDIDWLPEDVHLGKRPLAQPCRKHEDDDHDHEVEEVDEDGEEEANNEVDLPPGSGLAYTCSLTPLL